MVLSLGITMLLAFPLLINPGVIRSVEDGSCNNFTFIMCGYDSIIMTIVPASFIPYLAYAIVGIGMGSTLELLYNDELGFLWHFDFNHDHDITRSDVWEEETPEIMIENEETTH